MNRWLKLEWIEHVWCSLAGVLQRGAAGYDGCTLRFIVLTLFHTHCNYHFSLLQRINDELNEKIL